MAALSVEHLKVMAALTVEPAYAFNLLIGWGGAYGRAPKGPYGRAPKGSIYLLDGPSQISQKKGLLPHPYQSSH